MAFKKSYLFITVIFVSLLQICTARKTYIIKEKINSGELKVLQPRVQATASEWCWFESYNGDNKWCISGDQTWTVGYVNEYNYQQDQDNTNNIPANFLSTLSYESKHDSTWISDFNLPRMLQNKLTFAMNEFKWGLRFELYYWITEYAFCLNMAHFLEPITMTFTTETSLVQCNKKIINCFDDWTIWTDKDAKYFECSQSSSAAVQIYNYQPVLEKQENYLLGYNKYIQNFCWPGYSPFYSYFYEHPNNLQYASTQLWNAAKEFWYDFFGSSAGYKSSEKMPEREVQSSAFSYYQLCSELFKVLQSAIFYDGQEIKRNFTMKQLEKHAENDFARRISQK